MSLPQFIRYSMAEHQPIAWNVSESDLLSHMHIHHCINAHTEQTEQHVDIFIVLMGSSETYS